MNDPAPKGVTAGGTSKSFKGSLAGADPSGGAWGASAKPALEAAAAKALDEGPAAAAAIACSSGDAVLRVASSTGCFPLSLAEDPREVAEQAGAPAEGNDPKSPKSSSAGNTQVNTGLALE